MGTRGGTGRDAGARNTRVRRCSVGCRRDCNGEREIVRTRGIDMRNFIVGNVPPETISETPIDRRTKLRNEQRTENLSDR